ncbi:DUF1573 domain-containing protein [Chitinophaga deserti]|uniref:DUF1573 domain-containing protein n=1 Tax=Chitinophaga deserti TaxID=2164099 RepID=UPI000D6B7D2D|nr:DUF1573 domain-containing protein [Chitinophaga deserti]
MRFLSLFHGLAAALCLMQLSCSQAPREITINTGTMREALNTASREKKHLMAVVTYEGCPSCDKLLSAAKHYDTFQEVLDKYVVYRFNAMEPGQQWLDQWLYEKAYPIIILFSPEGKLLTVIKHGNAGVIKDLAAKALITPASQELYKHSRTKLPYGHDTLVRTLAAGFYGHMALQNNAATPQLREALSGLEKTVTEQPYFFNYYLLSKLHHKLGDSTESKRFADSALNKKGPLEAVLYPTLRAELKFQNDSSYDQYDDPYVAINETTINIGEVNRNQKPKATFTIKNIGKQPLLIRDMKVGCSCTAADWPKKPILPGEETTVTLTYKAAKEGAFTQSAYLLTNAFNSSVHITISGFVM